MPDERRAGVHNEIAIRYSGAEEGLVESPRNGCDVITVTWACVKISHEVGTKVVGCACEAQRSRTSTFMIACETGRILARCLLYTSPSPRDGLLSRMPS